VVGRVGIRTGGQVERGRDRQIDRQAGSKQEVRPTAQRVKILVLCTCSGQNIGLLSLLSVSFTLISTGAESAMNCPASY
jgi:hypothetical protein